MTRIDYADITRTAELGDIVQLTRQSQEVVKCEETGVLMLNIDADQLSPGDLPFIKKLGLTISNPDTDRPVALGVDYTENTFGHRVKSYFEKDDDDDDSSFFSSGGGSSFSFGGSSSFGGFGGFGGGSFSGGGASASW